MTLFLGRWRRWLVGDLGMACSTEFMTCCSFLERKCYDYLLHFSTSCRSEQPKYRRINRNNDFRALEIYNSDYLINFFFYTTHVIIIIINWFSLIHTMVPNAKKKKERNQLISILFFLLYISFPQSCIFN